MSLATLLVRMVSSRSYPPPTRQHGARRLRPSRQREGRRGRVSPGGQGVQGVVDVSLAGQTRGRIPLSARRTWRWRPGFERYFVVIAGGFFPTHCGSANGPLSPDNEITRAVNVA